MSRDILITSLEDWTMIVGSRDDLTLEEYIRRNIHVYITNLRTLSNSSGGWQSSSYGKGVLYSYLMKNIWPDEKTFIENIVSVQDVLIQELYNNTKPIGQIRSIL